ncbi:MAG TPA: pyridoxal phosphate-dependent aminotransferase [Bryobacteraceae bacterium]|nr:pyridoxal phosphate-dependent aminotransferase [Bryobacteraceae bacterium]
MRPEAVSIAARVADLKPTAINTILAEVRALRAQGREVASLMRGEPDFATPPHIVEAAMAALANGRTSYAENRGEAGLREAVATKLSRDNGVQYDPATEILITDGATLGIHSVLMALLGPGDEILAPDPIYDAYDSPSRVAGARANIVRSTRGAGGRFAIAVESLEEACTPATRALLLNTPWNPVGTVFTRAELVSIVEFVLRRNLILISDEIYEAITYGEHKHVSPASLSAEIRNRSVLVNSFSKTYAMTGWRLGYCAAPAHIISAMLLVLQQSSRGPATFIQDAGAAALRASQECVAEMRAAYSRRRDEVVKALQGIPGVDVLAPDGGFFVMLDVSRLGRSSSEIRKHLLDVHGVAVVHGAAYGACGEGTLRVSFATGGETLTRGLQVLRKGLQSI